MTPLPLSIHVEPAASLPPPTVRETSALYKKLAQVAPLWTEKDVATFLRLSSSTLRRWRCLRYGPPYIRVGSAIRYRPDEVQAWADKRTEVSTAASPTG